MSINLMHEHIGARALLPSIKIRRWKISYFPSYGIRSECRKAEKSLGQARTK